MCWKSIPDPPDVPVKTELVNPDEDYLYSPAIDRDRAKGFPDVAFVWYEEFTGLHILIMIQITNNSN